MTRLPTRILFALLTISGVVVLSAACKKDPPPAPLDLGGPPPSQDAGVVQLTPLDDAGDAAPEAEPARKKWSGGGGGNANAARIRACCNAIRHEAAKLGAAPEGVMMMTVAAQCDMVAAQVAGGSAPEFTQVRTMLKGHTIPNACQGM
jgi:predicted lipid-binding transport protein (Tim44 family)